MNQPIRILLNGAKGRMGLAIVNVAASEKAVIAAGVDQGDNLAAHIGSADVVIDFSFHSATLAVAQLCAQHQKPLVIGTTGHTAEEKAAITAAMEAQAQTGDPKRQQFQKILRKKLAERIGAFAGRMRRPR